MERLEVEERIERARLEGAKTLHLNGNQLTALPESLGQLTNLRELYLSDNQLTALPESLGQLTNLRELYLPTN
jgi:Leucine-rich repeat (LRR) protein